ncbi:type II and III secretion system protein family protein [Alterinioella nitratireducens]|uniref:type II and III secretion system protein family protein n=1 Tax=Alterinioella nitratireducens TaxID=2735915 RepID=UPI00155332DB|nr:type II and III secretion system protein family protein [Alterinioella nitratireducens]NPD19509.1 type II and III secretion system protein family protein [Alterinioella nitratireducens]
MSIIRHICAVLLGCAVIVTTPLPSTAQVLRVLEGATSTTLRVPMNRAVVVESEALFAELSVANPQIADIATLSERTIYVLGRAPGRTTMTLLGVDGGLIANVEVQVIPDLAEFRERLREILPSEAIEVRSANDGIVLSGTVSSGQILDRALELAQRYAPDRVSNLMVVGGTQQVMLRVRFAEMSRTVRRELNASFGATVGDFQLGTGNAAAAFPPSPSPSGDANGALGVTFGSGSAQFAVLLEALESNGMVRTLAEPNLSALSGATASFNAGGEFAVPVRSDDGVSIEFRPFGINLAFTPTVLSDEIINLNLAAEVSAIDADPALRVEGVPGLRTRTASTTVEMRDGESFVIAGLLQDDFRDSIGQVPWLGDIPVLGALFRSTNYQREQSELVIIVTAHLVSPTRGEALALPTDRVRIPTENELFLFGQTAGRPAAGSAAGDVAQQDFSGSYGYVME